jgi:hypothetical protein
MNPRYVVLGLLLVGIVVSLGCKPDNPLGRKPVHGKVTVNGEPAPAGSIIFDPGGKGTTLSGAVISQGAYEVLEEKGLAPGEYMVSVSVPDPARRLVPNRGGQMVVADLVPPNSQKKITVTADGPNAFDFEFKTR